MLSLAVPVLRCMDSAAGSPIAPVDAQRHLIYSVLFAATWAALALVLIRPDADDEVYLDLIVSYLSAPSAPIDSLFGFVPGTPHARYAIASLDPLRAVVAYLTGLPLLVIYYIATPPLIAALAAIISIRIFRLFLKNEWVVAMFCLTAILLIWGDAHRTYANFGLVRLFQGKATLVLLMVPAIILYFFQMIEGKHSRFNVLMLVCAMLGAIGATPNGLGVGPLLLLLLILSSIRLHDIRKYGAAFAVMTVILLPLAFYMAWNYGSIVDAVVHTGRGFVTETTNAEIYAMVFGDSPRGATMLVLTVLSIGFVVGGRIGKGYRNFVLLFIVLLAFPWTSLLLAKATFPTFSWRWLWIAPIPIFASVAVAGLYGTLRARAGRGFAMGALGVFLMALAQMHPRLVVSDANNVRIGWPQYRLPTAMPLEHDRAPNEVFLRDRREWARVEEGWLQVDSVGRRF